MEVPPLFVVRLDKFETDGSATLICGDIDASSIHLLQLYSITRRTNLPCSPAECSSPSSSFVHVLDIVSRLRKLRIQGSNDFYKSSNLIPNLLPVSFLPFKSVKNLILSDFVTKNVSSICTLRPTVNSLTCQNCQLSSLADILLCDVIHRDKLSDEYRWSSATNLNLKSNKIESIDEAVVLLEKLEVLDLSNNLISSLENNFLTKLPHLVALILTNNRIKILDSLHMKVGNLVKLNISHNKLSNLDGLSKLYSLEQLEAGWNCIEHLESVICVSSLPCLQRLVLNGNPVASIVDYRIKIFSLFGQRMSEIYFDNERPLPKEIDKALVLRALRMAQICRGAYTSYE
ncbi:hypothetical protein QYM36_006578 [Artemia franciscana]|uniref:Nischarin n=1 Tax=Artemia franciscana TaxID=6661 RepID=A0AA88L5N5_ARTSF|nr:hypothetical protein QYM36_006578 [Artemia franciscana]